MRRATCLAVLILLSGCGAETAGTAAVQGSLKAREAESAGQIQQPVQERLDAAREAQQSRERALQDAGQ